MEQFQADGGVDIETKVIDILNAVIEETARRAGASPWRVAAVKFVNGERLKHDHSRSPVDLEKVLERTISQQFKTTDAAYGDYHCIELEGLPGKDARLPDDGSDN